MTFWKIASIFFILLGLYGIINLFIGKRRPIHIKKDVKIIEKYYKYYRYYYLLPYIIVIFWGITPFIYSSEESLILNPIHFSSFLTFNIMQFIGWFFIDSKYIYK